MEFQTGLLELCTMVHQLPSKFQPMECKELGKLGEMELGTSRFEEVCTLGSQPCIQELLQLLPLELCKLAPQGLHILAFRIQGLHIALVLHQSLELLVPSNPNIKELHKLLAKLEGSMAT